MSWRKIRSKWNASRKILNEHFIAIKVDREERPDVDSIYMDAVTGLTGHGGWPMSVFLTPDLKPFWAGTFVKRDQFIGLMNHLVEIWRDDRQKILESANSIAYSLQPKLIPPFENFDPQQTLQRAADALIRNFDQQYGGFGPAPKFPPHQQIQALLLSDTLFKDTRYQYAAHLTLEKIAKSGLFDHIDGGFHRYATDAKWEIPHFEKMLYDQASLIVSYVAGYEKSGFEPFLKIAEKTAEYALSRLKADHGGFYSAEDAGEVGKEGEFYVWSYESLKNLGEQTFTQVKDLFMISERGNFEGNNTLVAKDITKLVSIEARQVIESLKSARDLRPRPDKDTKVIVSWNGLFLSALARLSQSSKNTEYLKEARALADVLIAARNKEGILLHLVQQLGLKSRELIPAMLEDLLIPYRWIDRFIRRDVR